MSKDIKDILKSVNISELPKCIRCGDTAYLTSMYCRPCETAIYDETKEPEKAELLANLPKRVDDLEDALFKIAIKFSWIESFFKCYTRDKPMRNLHEVIVRMEDALPDHSSTLPQHEADQVIAITETLSKIKKSCEYSAPENMQAYWHQVEHYAFSSFPKSYENLNFWQKRLIDIFTDQEEK